MAIIFGPDAFTVSSNQDINTYPTGSPDYAYCQGSNLVVNAAADNVQAGGGGGDTSVRCIDAAVSSSMTSQEAQGNLFVPTGVSAACYPGLTVRYSASTRGYQGLLQVSDQTNEVAIWEDDAGGSLLASADRGLVLNTVYASKLRAVGGAGGTLISFSVGGTAAVVFVDTTAPATGAPGMFVLDNEPQLASIDNFAVDDLAGFPLIAGIATTNGSGATVSPVVNLPSGCVAGDTLLMFIRNAAGGTITFPSEGTTWVQLFEDVSDASNDTTALAWKKADGSEGATLTMTSAFGTSGKFAAIVYRIVAGADPTRRAPEAATPTVGTTASVDAGTVTPTGGAKPYLLLYLAGYDGELAVPAGVPTDYVVGVEANSGTVGTAATNCSVIGSYREANVASENPGIWTIAASPNAGWTATVVAVHPAFGEIHRGIHQSKPRIVRN